MRINRSEYLAHADMRAAMRAPAVRTLYVAKRRKDSARESRARFLSILATVCTMAALFITATN